MIWRDKCERGKWHKQIKEGEKVYVYVRRLLRVPIIIIISRFLPENKPFSSVFHEKETGQYYSLVATPKILLYYNFLPISSWHLLSRFEREGSILENCTCIQIQRRRRGGERSKRWKKLQLPNAFSSKSFMRAPTPSFKPRSKQLGNNRERDAEETLEMAVPGTKGHVNRSTSNFDSKETIFMVNRKWSIEPAPRFRV